MIDLSNLTISQMSINDNTISKAELSLDNGITWRTFFQLTSNIIDDSPNLFLSLADSGYNATVNTNWKTYEAYYYGNYSIDFTKVIIKNEEEYNYHDMSVVINADARENYFSFTITNWDADYDFDYELQFEVQEGNTIFKFLTEYLWVDRINEIEGFVINDAIAYPTNSYIIPPNEYVTEWQATISEIRYKYTNGSYSSSINIDPIYYNGSTSNLDSYPDYGLIPAGEILYEDYSNLSSFYAQIQSI